MRKSLAIVVQMYLLLKGVPLAGANSEVLSPRDNDKTEELCEALLVVHPPLEFTRGGPILITRQGEVFLSVNLNHQMGIFEMTNRRLRIFESDASGRTDASARQGEADLFESRSGRTYYGYLSSAGVKVFDARRGSPILDLPFSHIPRLNGIQLEFGAPYSSLYKLLFFEEPTGGVHVALVPNNDSMFLDPAFTIPLVTIRLKDNFIAPGPRHLGIFRYLRLADRHLYAVGWERKDGGHPNTLLVHDLASRKDILRETFSHTQDPPIIIGQLSLYLDARKQPQLVMFLHGPNGKVLLFDRLARSFVPLSGIARTAIWGIQFFRDGRGFPWYAAAEGSESGRWTPDRFRLLVRPVDTDRGAIVRDLKMSDPEDEIHDVEVVETPVGRLVLAWERGFLRGQWTYKQLHIFNPSTGSLQVRQIPENWRGIELNKSFFNPVSGLVMSYFFDKGIGMSALEFNANRDGPEGPPPGR